MLDQRRAYIALLWPFIVGVVCFAVALFPETLSGQFKWTVFGRLSLEHTFQTGFVRLLFFAFGIAFFVGIPAFRDYSGFFPERMKVTACYDNEGIERFLNSLTKRDLHSLHVALDWEQRKSAYFTDLNDQLHKDHQNFHFSENVGQTISKGDLIFRVRSVDWGAQKYQIEEARVWFVHVTETPRTDHKEVLHTESDIDPAHAVIIGSPIDVFFYWGLLIRPVFRQKYYVSPSSEVTFHHSLLCATRVKIFPYPNLSETMYLYRSGDGEYVPIGYAFYSLP